MALPVLYPQFQLLHRLDLFFFVDGMVGPRED